MTSTHALYLNSRTALWTALAAAALLTACGGGSSPTSNTSLSTNVPTAGLISGVGSIVLNGIRYETIGAAVEDADDGTAFTSALSIGMTVSALDANINTSANTGTAATFEVQHGISGVTGNFDATANTLTVAGLPVIVDASTVVVSAAGLIQPLSAISNGLSVETYGIPQADGTFKATRIEIETSPSAIRLVGAVSNLDTINRTFTLGTAGALVTVSYSNATAPAGLVNGAVVSAHVNTASTASPYSATALYLRAGDATVFESYEQHYAGTSRVRDEANELYGMVSNKTATATGCTLQVQGIPTTLASTTLCAAVTDGDYVEVKGLFADGALAGYRVEFKTAGSDRDLSGVGYQDDSDDHDNDGVKYRRQYHSSSYGEYHSDDNASSYEIYGTLSCTSSPCTLTTRTGTLLNLDLTTAYWEHGQVSSGWVEVKGYATSASDFKVTKIESKDH